METRSKYEPIIPIHPGRLVLLEIKERGISQRELASLLNIAPSNLSPILKGHRPISPEFAVNLEHALGIEAEFWVRAQADYEATKIRAEKYGEDERKAMNVQTLISDKLNIQDVYKRIGVDLLVSIAKKIEAVERFFSMPIESVCIEASKSRGCFKRSTKLNVDDRNLLTWIALARKMAKDNAVQGYVSGDADLAAEEIAQAANTGNVSADIIKDTLNKHHIGYVHEPRLDKVPVDGYSTFVSGCPVIVVTYRVNDIYKLVFSVLHELGHISTHVGDEDSSFVALDGTYSSDDPIEKAANKFAQDKLIPPKIWAKISSAQPKSVQLQEIADAISNAAKKLNIHPKVAAYRYQYETGNYKIRTGKAERIF